MKPSRNNLLNHIIFFIWILVLGLQICCNLPQIRKSLVPQALRSKETETPIVPIHESIITSVTEDTLLDSINQLSGEIPVSINGIETYIKSRYSYAMFLDYSQTDALPYLIERSAQWVPAEQIEIDTYEYTDAERTYTWQNLIVQIPGKTTPDEKVILTAHFDSIVVREGDALKYAPGADDNATGTAVLLEAIRLFSEQPFEKTIELVFFSGEEEGAFGSRAYLEDHNNENIVAVINVDMIGYDSDNDACMEIHAGTNQESQNIAHLLNLINTQYQLELQPEILTINATNRSDHASFWEKEIPAVLVMENFFDSTTSDFCISSDPNPDYHLSLDTIDNINIHYVQKIAQMVLLTIAELAVPIN